MTPAKHIHYGDMQVIGDGLVISWHMEENNITYIWNSQQGKVQEIGIKSVDSGGLRISGDGSRVFCVDQWKIQSWSIGTQKLTRKDSNTPHHFLDPLCLNNSKILVQVGILSKRSGILGP